MKTLDLQTLLRGKRLPGARHRAGGEPRRQKRRDRLFHHGQKRQFPQPCVLKRRQTAFAPKRFDESKLTDPHLIIYSPVRVLGNKTIVTNGDQTDTIYDLMDKQQTFEQALRTREYEDDAPNYTPRISGIVHLENGGCNYALSILL